MRSLEWIRGKDHITPAVLRLHYFYLGHNSRQIVPFVPSAICQTASPYFIGSDMTDEQFKQRDELSFLQTTTTAVELFNSVIKKKIGQLGLDKKGRAF